MDAAAVKINAVCSFGTHSIFAWISLVYDTRAWYDTVSAFAVVIPVAVLFLHQDMRVTNRGVAHMIAVLVAVIGQEVSRQSKSIDWNLLTTTEHLGPVMFMANLIKGVGTFIKIVPLIKVINETNTEIPINWKDVIGWLISVLSSIYLLQQPSIYRNEKMMAEWRVAHAWIETLHWAGLALSASVHFRGPWVLILPIASLQPLCGYVVNKITMPNY